MFYVFIDDHDSVHIDLLALQKNLSYFLSVLFQSDCQDKIDYQHFKSALASKLLFEHNSLIFTDKKFCFEQSFLVGFISLKCFPLGVHLLLPVDNFARHERTQRNDHQSGRGKIAAIQSYIHSLGKLVQCHVFNSTQEVVPQFFELANSSPLTLLISFRLSAVTTV